MAPDVVRKKRRRHRAKKDATVSPLTEGGTTADPSDVVDVPDFGDDGDCGDAPAPAPRAAPLQHKSRAPPVFSAAEPVPVVTPAIASAHPFPTDPHDHAETPYAAYADIEPLLFGLALQLRSNKARLRIWDPYFCEGSVVRHLNRLGFESVRNENADFYATVADGRTPPFDVLVTNPPFSGDHMERFLGFLATLDRPWFALMPQFVAQKRYFLEWRAAAVAAGREAPLFLGPSRSAYAFTAPALAADGSTALVEDAAEARRALPDGVRVFAGKFQCVWFACLGAHRDAVLTWWRRKYAGRPGVTAVVAEDDPLALPQLVHAKKPAPAERRWRKKLHRLHSKQQQPGGRGDERGGAEEEGKEPGSAGKKRLRA